ncbi:DUF397 domain-containing protein [Streptomyces sp. NPDC055078]
MGGSSYSGGAGGGCLEVALSWHKSSHSGGGNCVEGASCPTTTIHIRDSKNPTGPRLSLPSPAWAAFLSTLR